MRHSQMCDCHKDVKFNLRSVKSVFLAQEYNLLPQQLGYCVSYTRYVYRQPGVKVNFVVLEKC